MSDPIQDDLAAWVHHGDLARGGEAIRAIADDWRGRIRRFLPQPSPEEVEDALHDALLALCTSDGAPPRALAPREVASPAAWRARVLKNHLIDRHRRRRRRAHAEQAARHGWSPAVEKAAWRAGLSVVDTPVAPAQPDLDDPFELVVERARVIAALPELTIRRRVLVLLALGADPSPFLVELAADLGETVESVVERVAEAARAPHDATHDHLSTAMVRVVYPDQPVAKAREAARKAFARAIDDLRARLREPA